MCIESRQSEHFISALSKSKKARDHTGPKVVLKYSALKPPMRSPCIKSAPSPAAKADLVLREDTPICTYHCERI